MISGACFPGRTTMSIGEKTAIGIADQAAQRTAALHQTPAPSRWTADRIGLAFAIIAAAGGWVYQIGVASADQKHTAKTVEQLRVEHIEGQKKNADAITNLIQIQAQREAHITILKSSVESLKEEIDDHEEDHRRNGN